jgi:hypothetical protein
VEHRCLRPPQAPAPILPLETIQALNNGKVSVGPEGIAEWRSIDAAGITKTVTITPDVAGGHWKIYTCDVM